MFPAHFWILIPATLIVLFVCTALGFKFAKITRTSEEGVLIPLNFKDISRHIVVAEIVLLPIVLFGAIFIALPIFLVILHYKLKEYNILNKQKIIITSFVILSFVINIGSTFLFLIYRADNTLHMP